MPSLPAKPSLDSDHTQIPSNPNLSDDTATVTNANVPPDEWGSPRFAPPSVEGEIGRLGKYRVQKELGRGGMGAVYLAFDERLQRKVALKVMLPKAAANDMAKERFLREARAAAQISSDYVVNIHEADEIDGTPYIALQFLQGSPLDEYLKKKGTPSIPQIMHMARETALGLAAAHKLGIIHRDIKPANLWLEAPNGRVKILDFGLAKPVVGTEGIELTGSGAVMGTPAYMSPEQGLGKAVDGRSDLFSLGCVLYRLCTGKLPFEGSTLMATLMLIATEEPKPVRELNPTVPEPLADLIRRLMAKKAADRPASAMEVAKELGRLSDAEKKPEGSAAQPQVVYVPMAVSVQEENPFQDIEEPTEYVSEPARPKAPPKPPRKFPALLVGLLCLGFLAVLGGVIIIIKNKDGTETKIEVADDATITVKGKDGKQLAKVGPNNPKKPVIADNSVDRKAAEWVITQGGFVWANNEPKSIRAVADLPKDRFNLTDVDLNNTQMSDAGLGHLKELKSLRSLDLLRTQVSDAGLVHLKELKSLTRIILNGTKVTDAGLVHLKELKSLTQFTLSNTQVSGAGLIHLKELKNLTLLNLNDTQVTGEGLVHLKELKGLLYLHLNGTKVSDAGLEHLKELKGLTQLPLNSTAVTDAGLVHLKELKSLTYLDLKMTKVTAKGLEALHESLPGCKIDHDGGVIEAIDVDRKAAEWLLASKAHFAISNEKGHQEFQINTSEKLPAGGFHVMSFRLPADKFGGDADLARFRNLTKLGTVVLSQTAVTDVGLEHLAAMQSLTKLYLAGTKVTDAGLALLTKCQKLDTLHIQKTAVTEAGVKKLAAALPKCQIEWDGGVIEPKSDNSLLFDGMNFIELPLQMDPKSLFTFEGYFVPRGIQAGHWLTMDGLPAITIDASKNWAFKVTTPKQTTEHASNVKPADWQNAQSKGAHVALVADAKEIRLYINGILAKSAPRPADMVLPAASGKMILAGNFAGTADEIRISKTPRYGKDFIPAERFTPDADTLALYHCDEGKGHVLGDSSGNGNHGRAIAPKWRMANGQEKIIAAPLTAAQRKSLEFLFSVGGSITYLGQGWMSPRKMEDLPNGPVRIESISVDHIPGHKINGEGRPITDKDIPFLRDLPPTKGFVLASTANHLSLQGLESLTKLPLMASVEKFWLLGGKEPLGPSFKYLANLGSLNYLAVHGLQPEDSSYLSDLAASPNLQVLDISYSRIREFHRLKALPQLRWLGFSHEVNMNFNAADVAELTQLRKLASQGGDISDPSLEHIGRMTSLEWLDLHGTAITDKGLEHLQKMTGLTFLSVNACSKVTEAGVKKLAAALPKCKISWSGGVIEPKLVIGLVPMPPTDAERRATERALALGAVVRVDGKWLEIRTAADLPKTPFVLTSLGFSLNPKVTDAELAIFKDCTGVTHLGVGECPMVTDAGLAHFRNCKDLVHLNVTLTRITDAGLAHFKDCKLTDLRLGGSDVTGTGLAYFKDCRLTILNASNLPITDDVIRSFTGLQDILHLELGGTKVTDAGLAHFKDCKKIGSLNLGNTAVTNAGLAHFANCKEMNILYLGKTAITDAGLATFKDCEKLWLLDLVDTNVTDAGLAHLKNCKRLGEFGLSRTKVTDAGLVHLKDCKLNHLTLNQTAVTDAGLDHLKGHSGLTALQLRQTKVTAEGVRALSLALPKCKIEWDGGVIEPK